MELYRQVLYHKDKWHTGEMDAFIELAKETFQTSSVSDEFPQSIMRKVNITSITALTPNSQYPVIPCYVIIECSKPHVERGREAFPP